jgi:hypothetical protein
MSSAKNKKKAGYPRFSFKEKVRQQDKPKRKGK